MKTPDIADDSITSDKIRDGAVGNANIADNSITSDKILDGSITSEDLATGTGFSGDSQEQVSQIIFSTCSIDFDVVAAQIRLKQHFVQYLVHKLVTTSLLQIRILP